MKICLIDVFLMGIVILFACLFRKTEGMKGYPISPKNETYRPLRFREMFRELRDNSTISDDYSEMTQLEYSSYVPYAPYTTSDTVTHVSEPPQRSFFKLSLRMNAVKKHDDLNLHLPSSGETERASGSNPDTSQPISLFREAYG